VTWFTFLPSFISILAGGPIVESTHNDLKFTAPLSAITAARGGGRPQFGPVFWLPPSLPQGFSGTLHAASALIAVGACSRIV
jgi:chromate transporter